MREAREARWFGGVDMASALQDAVQRPVPSVGWLRGVW